MRRIILLAIAVSLAAVGCTTEESTFYKGLMSSNEVAMAPVSSNGKTITRGYVESDIFEETYYSNLHVPIKPESTPRIMRVSSYLYPQVGEKCIYFVDKSFKKGEDNLWRADPAIYWPVGGKLGFLAISFTTEEKYNKGINVVWDSENAAKKVTLTVPAENTQNDILFAGTDNLEAGKESSSIPMEFKHAQAWLEFQITGTGDAVKLKNIEIEKIYNTGTLTINNDNGNVSAQWNFAEQRALNVSVDNINDVGELGVSPQYLDMLIPQQQKTAFILNYYLGSSKKLLSYRFITDQKTWLMGEKYIYKININSNEITVAPEVSKWETKNATEARVKVSYYRRMGEVNLETLDEDSPSSSKEEVTCTIWGSRVKMTATANEGHEFFRWDDGNIENPRTVAVTEDVTYHAEFFPNDAIGGGFTVNSSGKKVAFSKGNLQANIDASGSVVETDGWKWRFAKNQAGYIGNAVANTKIGMEKGIVDLFCWSVNTTESNWGIHTQVDGAYIMGDFNDWGQNIGNGTTWRTLSIEEWTYLLNIDGVLGRSDVYRFAKAKSPSDRKGLLIFPDEYSYVTTGKGISAVNDASASYPEDSISLQLWEKMERLGVVFLPASGHRSAYLVTETEEVGEYWSASKSSEATTGDRVFGMSFTDNSISLLQGGFRSRGRSVRLVTDLN